LQRSVDRARTKEIIQSEDRERLMKLSQTAADLMAEVILAGDIEDLVVNLPQHSMLPSEAAYSAGQALAGRESRTNYRGMSCLRSSSIA
jgi:hypothetical protein